MIRSALVYGLLLTLVSSCSRYAIGSEKPQPPAEFLSQQLLERQKAGQGVADIIDRLATLNPSALRAELNTKEKQLAFWINTYNGMVQYWLAERPDLWENRGRFFSGKRITIAGELVSLENIEHGVIRGTEAKLGLGFVPKFFPSKFEQTFKIKKGDPRIHFALNCGAISCPPVEIYRAETVNERLDHRSRVYLERNTTLSADGRTVTTTPLFKWFKGDFNAYGGINDFLVHFGILSEENKRVKRAYTSYDWTLALDVWATD
ncbi:MAG: DUF547 domain-containing protein [Bacteroidota bacterium]